MKMKKIKIYIRKILKDFKTMRTVLNEKSYYPELKRKSKIRRKLDLYKHYLKQRYPNEYYNSYGLDIVGSDPSAYIDYEEFRRYRDKKNDFSKDYKNVIRLRNKDVFSDYFSKFEGINVVSNVAVVEDGKIETLFNLPNGDYFVKSIDGQSGDAVYLLKKDKDGFKENDNPVDLTALLGTRSFVVQKRIIQHPTIAMFNEKSVNTIRIVTIYDNDRLFVLSSRLRIGASDNYLDHFNDGAQTVAINRENGTLKKYAFRNKNAEIPKTDRCSVSNQVFEGFAIPFYKEAEEMCLKAHGHLKNIHSIGWDVATTTEGPILIEGNDNWGMALMQIADGGLKSAFYNK